jgi:hypothetical protein
MGRTLTIHLHVLAECLFQVEDDGLLHALAAVHGGVAHLHDDADGVLGDLDVTHQVQGHDVLLEVGFNDAGKGGESLLRPRRYADIDLGTRRVHQPQLGDGRILKEPDVVGRSLRCGVHHTVHGQEIEAVLAVDDRDALQPCGQHKWCILLHGPHLIGIEDRSCLSSVAQPEFEIQVLHHVEQAKQQGPVFGTRYRPFPCEPDQALRWMHIDGDIGVVVDDVYGHSS